MKKLLGALMALVMCLVLTSCSEKVDPYEGVPLPVATITMENGKVMRAELYVGEAPNTVGNFIDLANSGFYDGLEFYRIVAGCLIQTGDPVGDGTGGPGYTIEGEFPDNGVKNDVKHTRGTLSMARLEDDKNSAGSQFFILQSGFSEYDGKYAAFGRLMDEASIKVLDGIAASAADGDYRPLMSQKIASIRVDTQGYVFPVVKQFPEEEGENDDE